MISEAEIFTALKTVIDPELGHNIVDLGLVYRAEIHPDQITIVMTLTTPGCPLAPYFVNQVKETVAATASLAPEDITVDLTFDPPWTPDAIHPDLRLQLGL